MLKAFKYRLYPNKEQRTLLAKTFGCVRFVYNYYLAKNIELYKSEQKHMSKIDCNNDCNRNLKKEYTWLKEVDKFALTNAIFNLDNAFQKFFKGDSGFPKFKSKKVHKDSYTTNFTSSNIELDFSSNKLKLPKLKWVKCKLHKKFDGKIKSATISKTPSGRYYASILVETNSPSNVVSLNMSKACGIDVGIKHFAVITNDSGSYKVDHPHYLKKAEKKLKRLQKQLSRKKIDSKNREKARLRLARCHQYVSSIRQDFLHKLSKAVIDDNQVIVVEDLNVKGMVKNHHLAKSISDSSWSAFVRYLEYKAQWYDKKLIKVDRFYPSSKTCSNCGTINQSIDLSVRDWLCPNCGTYHDRDINASRNLYLVGLEQPEVTPVEIGSVDDRKVTALPKKHPICEAGSLATFSRG